MPVLVPEAPGCPVLLLVVEVGKAGVLDAAGDRPLLRRVGHGDQVQIRLLARRVLHVVRLRDVGRLLRVRRHVHVAVALDDVAVGDGGGDDDCRRRGRVGRGGHGERVRRGGSAPEEPLPAEAGVLPSQAEEADHEDAEHGADHAVQVAEDELLVGDDRPEGLGHGEGPAHPGHDVEEESRDQRPQLGDRPPLLVQDAASRFRIVVVVVRVVVESRQGLRLEVRVGLVGDELDLVDVHLLGLLGFVECARGSADHARDAHEEDEVEHDQQRHRPVERAQARFPVEEATGREKKKICFFNNVQFIFKCEG